MNNAVFGKTMENVRARVDYKFTTTKKSFKKWVSTPRYKGHTIYHENLVGVSMTKASAKLFKPVYAGFSILDNSKLVMYQFHYDYMKQKYGNKSKLMFTDTDPLCYEIETEDFYKDMQENKEHFDLSSYGKNHFLYDTENAKKIQGADGFVRGDEG